MNVVRTSDYETSRRKAAVSAARAQAATIRPTATNPLWMITAALAVFAGVMAVLISTV